MSDLQNASLTEDNSMTPNSYKGRKNKKINFPAVFPLRPCHTWSNKIRAIILKTEGGKNENLKLIARFKKKKNKQNM